MIADSGISIDQSSMPSHIPGPWIFRFCIINLASARLPLSLPAQVLLFGKHSPDKAGLVFEEDDDGRELPHFDTR